MKFYSIDSCRLCKSKNLLKRLSLTPTPWADDYFKNKKLQKSPKEIPLDLYECQDCKHVQLKDIINAEEIYLNYSYETESTLGLGEHFIETADYTSNLVEGNDGLVIDIGSNDGILLKYYKQKGFKILGIDPMPGIAKKATENGVETLPIFFNSKSAADVLSKFGKAKIISSNNLVADTDDLDDFIDGVNKILDDDGIFFFETFYFYLQVKNFVWDFTYHEHYSYFLIRPLKEYFLKKGLEIIEVKTNLTKGGSIRIVLQKKGASRKINDQVNEFIKKEEDEGFYNGTAITEYGKKINKSKIDFDGNFEKIISKTKNIAGFGASATSTTLIYHFNLGDKLKYLVDDFYMKHNTFSPGYEIPVYETKKIYEDMPEYVVILAWRYKDKIISKNKAYLDKGGKFIIPLPNFKIIDSSNFE
jgi:2-polyprenyl-3-methyl-5-hydroxy-6-metoxy-1,4-benzoquinol methylase